MNPTQTDLPATLAAIQDQLDDLVAVVRAQQRTIDALAAPASRVRGGAD